MIKLLAGGVAARRVSLFEVAGAAAVIVGLTLWLGGAAGFIAAGVALLGKSFEWDVKGPRP